MANTLAASPLGVPLRALTAFWAAIAQGMRMLVIFPAVKQMYAPEMPGAAPRGSFRRGAGNTLYHLTIKKEKKYDEL